MAAIVWGRFGCLIGLYKGSIRGGILLHTAEANGKETWKFNRNRICNGKFGGPINFGLILHCRN